MTDYIVSMNIDRAYFGIKKGEKAAYEIGFFKSIDMAKAAARAELDKSGSPYISATIYEDNWRVNKGLVCGCGRKVAARIR